MYEYENDRVGDAGLRETGGAEEGVGIVYKGDRPLDRRKSSKNDRGDSGGAEKEQFR